MIIIIYKDYLIGLLDKEVKNMNNLLKEIKIQYFSNWDKKMLKNSEYVALFPNVMIGLHVDHFYVFWLEPLAMNKTREHMQMYYVGDESANGEEFKDLRKENSRFWKDVMLEDVNAIEGMQEEEIHQYTMVETFHQ